MLQISDLKFDEKGLIPAVVVDADSKQVLTLAYMNRESLSVSMERGLTCFWSRSRAELWLKGETSGNYQHIVRILADCDGDALTVEVKKDGPACHTGEESCFFRPLYEAPKTETPQAEQAEAPFSLDGLYALLLDRKEKMPAGSYTTYLFEKGLDKILKKIGEESTEVIIGAKNDRAEAIYEVADLTYHVLVLLAELGIPLAEVRKELASRHVIDHKVKQEKMK